MLIGRDIVIFGDDWGRYPSTIQHIARVLLRSNRIFWIGSLGLRRPHLRISDVRRVWEKGFRMFSTSKEGSHASGPICLHPVVMPLHDNALFHRLTMASVRRAIRNAMDSLNAKNPVILSSSPWTEALLGEFEESSAHYFCLDDYTLFDDVFQSVRNAEQEFIKQADSCFFVSDALRAKHGENARNAYILPQGVDVAHFAKSGSDTGVTAVPGNKPVVGFIGLVASWIDLELIARCAHAYPEAIVVIIGKVAVNESLLPRAPNIMYLGEISYDLLPGYMRRFTVGLIPFVVNELTVAANPLKLLEYMAAGMPVVSTNLPEVAKFEPLVYVAKNSDDFLELVGCALRENGLDRARQRKEKAAEFSWENITENICAIIGDLEKQKGSKVDASGNRKNKSDAVS